MPQAFLCPEEKSCILRERESFRLIFSNFLFFRSVMAKLTVKTEKTKKTAISFYRVMINQSNATVSFYGKHF
jgi:hypothetical protein